MATNFPASLDSLTNPTSSDSLSSPSHAGQHANVNDAVEALQAKVGADSSGVVSSHDYKIAQLEAISHGKILQVVSTTKTDRFSTTSTSYVDITGYSVSITPTSTSSKILVVPYLNSSITGDYVSYFQMMRGATAIMQGDIVGTAQQVSWANAMGLNWDYGIYSTTAVYLDSPNTTSATTYKVQCKVNNAAGTLKVNSDGVGGTSGIWFTTASSITVLEVSA